MVREQPARANKALCRPPSAHSGNSHSNKETEFCMQACLCYCFECLYSDSSRLYYFIQGICAFLWNRQNFLDKSGKGYQIRFMISAAATYQLFACSSPITLRRGWEQAMFDNVFGEGHLPFFMLLPQISAWGLLRDIFEMVSTPMRAFLSSHNFRLRCCQILDLRSRSLPYYHICSPKVL